MKPVVFRGERYKVRLSFTDLSGTEIPAQFRAAAPNFCVEILPVSAKPTAAFSNGRVYYGPDFRQAWVLVAAWVQAPVKMPAAWERRFWK